MTDSTIIKHDLPAPYEVISSGMAADIEAVIANASLFTKIESAEDADVANHAAVQLHAVHKAVLAHAEQVKKPLNQLIKAVRECLDRAEVPLANAKQTLQRKIADWNTAQQKLIAEAQAKADAERRAAEAAAAAEQKRLQDEANAKAAEANRLAREKAEAAAKEAEELIGGTVAPEPVKEVRAEVIAPVRVAAVTTVVPVAAPSAVVTKQVRKLDIFDMKALAQAYCVGGIVLVEPREADIKRAMEAGLTVPGCRMILVDQVASRGTR